VALMFGFGRPSRRARAFLAPLRWFGKGYIAIVRGVPDIAFFLFFVIALDQAFEWLRHQVKCPDWDRADPAGQRFHRLRRGQAAALLLPQWVHETYGFFLAVLTFAIVFGAFAANVLFGAMRAVPRAQMETAEAYGMSRRQTFWRILVPQMWVYALPGPVEPLDGADQGHAAPLPAGGRGYRLLGARAGRHQDRRFTDYPHPTGGCGISSRFWSSTSPSPVSRRWLERLMQKLTHGQATTGGEAQRKAAA
jgi:polar amino acid transport system permease protein